LQKARLSGLSETAQTLTYLLALRAYGETEENAEYSANAAEQCFVAEPFWGDDLVVRPTPLLQEEANE
jgi:hypothetical protein